MFFLLQAIVLELEREVEELRQLWKSDSSTRPDIIHSLLPSSMFLEEDSERMLKVAHIPDSPDRLYDHECACARRAEVVKYRGISLLNEVDAQYSALQAKYDELLQHCHLGPQEDQQDEQSHRSVQTSSPADLEEFEEDFHQPEYKELFREIFSRIQKTKEDLSGNRGRGSAGDLLPNLH